MTAPAPPRVVPAPAARAASAPIAGFARAAIGVSMAQAISEILLFFLSQVTPLEIQPQVSFVTVTFIAGALAYAGKVLREKGVIVGDVI